MVEGGGEDLALDFGGAFDFNFAGSVAPQSPGSAPRGIKVPARNIMGQVLSRPFDIYKRNARFDQYWVVRLGRENCEEANMCSLLFPRPLEDFGLLNLLVIRIRVELIGDEAFGWI